MNLTRLLLLSMFLLPTVAAAQPMNAPVDPTRIDADFEIQGEYVGTIEEVAAAAEEAAKKAGKSLLVRRVTGTFPVTRDRFFTPTTTHG